MEYKATSVVVAMRYEERKINKEEVKYVFAFSVKAPENLIVDWALATERYLQKYFGKRVEVNVMDKSELDVALWDVEITFSDFPPSRQERDTVQLLVSGLGALMLFWIEKENTSDEDVGVDWVKVVE